LQGKGQQRSVLKETDTIDMKTCHPDPCLERTYCLSVGNRVSRQPPAVPRVTLFFGETTHLVTKQGSRTGPGHFTLQGITLNRPYLFQRPLPNWQSFVRSVRLLPLLKPQFFLLLSQESNPNKHSVVQTPSQHQCPENASYTHRKRL
jgi:hypothetical protein